jgi:tetratricopeptide (TPR) repeat protein
MERMMLQADRLSDQLKLKGPATTEEDLNKLIAAYRGIADKAPLVTVSSEIKQASDEKKQAWALGSLAITRIGNLYLDRKAYDRAFDLFKEVAENPTTTPLQRNAVINYMAHSAENLGNYPEAAELFDSLSAGYLPLIAPDNPNLDALDGPIKSADMWMRAGNKEIYFEKTRQAESYFKALIDNYKGTLVESAAVGKLSALYLKLSRFADAIEALSSVRNDSSGNISPGVLMTIADIYMSRLRDFRSAEKIYRDFLEFYPNHESFSASTLGLGFCLFEQARYAQARETVGGIEKMSNVSQQTAAQANYLIAICYEKEDKWELARGQLDFVRTSFAGTDQAFEAALYLPNYYRRRGMTDMVRKSFDEIVRYISKYADENAANPVAASRALGYLVRAYTENDDIKAAAEQLTLLHDRFPQFPEGKFAPLRLSEIYQNSLFDTARAIAWLKIFIDENPDAKDVENLKEHLNILESRTGITP